MKTRLAAIVLLAACSTTGSSVDGEATSFPITGAGPDLVGAAAICDPEGGSGNTPTIALELGLDLLPTDGSLDANATIVIAGSRMSLDSFARADANKIVDRTRALGGHEQALIDLCNEPLVEIVDVRVTSSDGVTMVPSIHLVPSWDN